MFLVPKVMSTQHPDNATPAPFADDAGVLKGEGEVDEAVSVFEMGCDEQMWDSEGKEADSQVVRKLLTNYPDFFQNGHQLGRDMALTLRVPNPRIERDMRKSMVEALQSVPSSWDMARSFYGEGHAPPIQEVILPLTTSAEDISMVEAYYRKVIVGQEDQTLLDGRSVKDWVGEFLPKTVRVIPLIEDMEHLLDCDGIVEEYLRDRDLPHQRVFLARSDPALTYGLVSAELILKVALLRLHNLEDRLGLPLYPIIGAGSVPFRGHLTPVNIERAFVEYPTAQTFTVQSAFKYDYPEKTVREGIAKIRAHDRAEPVLIAQERARRIIDKTTEEYQSQVQRLATLIKAVSAHVPKRRERKMHVGLFGYGRSLGLQDDIPQHLRAAEGQQAQGDRAARLGHPGRTRPRRPRFGFRGRQQRRRAVGGAVPRRVEVTVRGPHRGDWAQREVQDRGADDRGLRGLADCEGAYVDADAIWSQIGLREPEHTLLRENVQCKPPPSRRDVEVLSVVQ